MKETISLIDRLEEAGVIEAGEIAISQDNSSAAWDVFYEYINENSGWANRKILGAYRFLKGNRFTEGANSLLDKVILGQKKDEKIKKVKKIGGFLDLYAQIYFGGAMTRSDQEAFALIANKEPWKLTVWSSLLSASLSPQYYLYVQAGGFMHYLLSDGDIGRFHELGLGLTGFIAGANIARMTMAIRNKKSYAAINIKGLVINSTTYMKKTSDFLRKNFSPEKLYK